MQHINVNDDFRKMLLEGAAWERTGIKPVVKEETEEEAPVLEEAKSKKGKEKEVVEEEEGHFCPLCEYSIEEPISDEQILEHTSQMLMALNEANSFNIEEALEELSEEDLAELEEAAAAAE